MSPTSDRVIEALARLHRYVESQPTPRQTLPLTIAISRQAGARGAEIAQAVGARLGWPVYDCELLTHIAQEKGLNARLLDHLDERCTNWLEEIITGFSTQYSPTEWTYMKQLLHLLVSLGQVGHCVIVGRGAGHVLPAPTTLHVRLIAPRDVRVSKTEKRKGLSKPEAERWVDQTDSDRTRFVKYRFDKDPNDPLNYDVILNSGRYSTEECAELIVQAARVKDAQVNKPASALRQTA
jgi:cytidylate kinase